MRWVEIDIASLVYCFVYERCRGPTVYTVYYDENKLNTWGDDSDHVDNLKKQTDLKIKIIVKYFDTETK